MYTVLIVAMSIKAIVTMISIMYTEGIITLSLLGGNLVAVVSE